MNDPKPYIHFDLSGGPQFPDPDRPPESLCGQAGAFHARDWRDVTCPRCLHLLGWDLEEGEEGWEPTPCPRGGFCTEEPCAVCGECCGCECPGEEPEIDDEPPPDYGPPGSGAIITEYP